MEQSKLETEDRNRQLQTLVNGLTAENLELKSRMARLELETTEKTGRLKKVESEVLKLQEAVEKLLETLPYSKRIRFDV